MDKMYLLAFIEDCYRLPQVKSFNLGISTWEKVSVLWTASLTQQFKNKRAFVSAMLELHTLIIQSRLTSLPISIGTRVSDPINIEVLLKNYSQLIKESMKQITGCCEYTLWFSLADYERGPLLQTKSNFEILTGKDYLEKIKEKLKNREKATSYFEKFKCDIVQFFTPAIKDINLGDIDQNKGNFEIAILVHYDDINIIEEKLNALVHVEKHLLYFTGPWPPFHFSKFSFQAEPFIVHENLIW